MRPTPDIEWRFAGPDDAASYRTEVARLWASWMVGMAVLLFASSWVWLLAVGVLGAVLMATRPLQRRAAVIVPDDEVPDPGISAAFARSTRDRVLRELAFGEAPLRASGAGAGWLWARRAVVLATIGAFAYVAVDLLSGSQ